MAGNAFEFKKWCEEYELEQDTVTLLQEKGFKSYKSISRITSELLKKEFKGLVPGQFLLLQAAVEMLQPPPAPAPQATEAAASTSQGSQHKEAGGSSNDNPPPTNTSTSTETASADIQTRLAAGQQLTPADMLSLWGVASGTSTSQTPAAVITATDKGKQPPSDPFGFGIGPYSGSKIRKISDYITNTFTIDANNDENSTVTIGGVEFAMGKGRKIPHDKIRIQHYMEGCLRILRELIVDDNMPIPQIVNHINYLIQISCLSQTNQWRRVLNYDTLYRREQQQHGFAWGSSSPVLMQSQLSSPEPQAAQQNKTQPTTSRTKKLPNVTHPTTGNIICDKWNGRGGCHITWCRYSHACKLCFASDHNEVQHREQGLASQPKNV